MSGLALIELLTNKQGNISFCVTCVRRDWLMVARFDWSLWNDVRTQ